MKKEIINPENPYGSEDFNDVDQDVRYDILVFKLVARIWEGLMNEEIKSVSNSLKILEIFLSSYFKDDDKYYSQVKALRTKLQEQISLIPPNSNNSTKKMLALKLGFDLYRLLDHKMHEIGFKPRKLTDDYI